MPYLARYRSMLCGAAWLGLGISGYGAEISGLLDVRASTSNTNRSWTRSGLGKARYDQTNEGLRLGQGIFVAETELNDTVTGSLVFAVADDRDAPVDLQEAWLGWNPLPVSAWKMRARFGAFFPSRMNLEIDYDRQTWTPSRTISASAVNSWVGEELRIKGVEFTLKHLGRAARSPHDFSATGAVFGGNDSAGTLLAWRGWTIGDRISGLNEPIRLADLPVYRSSGVLSRQARDIHPFREIDGRLGYYAGANYDYAGRLEISAMHYDNRGDPLIVKDGQYSWETIFDHAGFRLKLPNDWEILFQALRGSTLMGAHAVDVNYAAGYLLASHPLGDGRLTVRVDQFKTEGKDLLPSDPNDENGRALALAYSRNLTESVSFVTEVLALRSSRSARRLTGEPVQQNELSLTASLRKRF